MESNVLVVMAHPDDEVLGCGGVIAKHARGGDNVFVAILGEGKSSRGNADNADVIKSEILALRREAQLANKILGVREVIFHNFPDNAIDTIALLSVIQYVEMLKQKYRPSIVYTHHHSDINIDHQLIFKAVITAFRPIKGDQVPYIYSCEVPSATEWQAPFAGFAFQPNVFVDISDTLELKKRALGTYRSELRLYPHPRSVEAIDIIARRWGTTVGFDAAEPFVLVRNVIRTVGSAMHFVIRSATTQDEADILRWRNDRIARMMSDKQDIIAEDEHAKWYKTKLTNANYCIYMAIGDLDVKLGMIRFDKLDKGIARVSINLAPDRREKGLGKKLLQRGIDMYLAVNRDVTIIEAIIKNENKISEHIFSQAGFEERTNAGSAEFFKLIYKKR